MKSNDIPVTDAELDQFYGTAPTEVERNLAIGWAKAQFDAGELADVVHGLYEEIEQLLSIRYDTDALICVIGLVVVTARKQRIADIASRKLFGKVGSISPSEVL